MNTRQQKQCVVTGLLVGLVALWAGTANAEGLPDFTRLVKQYAPAVVNISTSQQAKGPRWRLPEGMEIPDIPEDSPFRDFFRHFFDEEGEKPEYRTQSLGSGFIISEDGFVLTNNHVIEDADTVIVRLNDRRELDAKVIGTDSRSDLALLKVDAKGLPAVAIGNSRELEVGEWVLAIGSPFGFDYSVTAGIVSAKGRSLPNENYVPFIQTDVAINPGNSGGPLFNLEGEVVGINSQIYSRTGGFMGLSFAIPVDMAMQVVEQLKTKGYVSRGWLGVLIQNVTRELAESFGMEQPEGALVAQVLPDSPAEAAGFEVGDVIVRFGDKPVAKSSDLPPLVGATEVDSKVPVEIVRNGKEMSITVTIGELPEDAEQAAAQRGEGGEAGEMRLGVAVTDVPDEMRAETGIESGGVLVRSVGPGPAQTAGVREGDVILRVNNIPVDDAAHFKRLSGELPEGKSIALLVQRGGSPLFLALKIPAQD